MSFAVGVSGPIDSQVVLNNCVTELTTDSEGASATGVTVKVATAPGLTAAELSVAKKLNVVMFEPATVVPAQLALGMKYNNRLPAVAV